MPALILINGAPGSGKSTLAEALARRLGDATAVDVDALKHPLPLWPADPFGAGLEARRLALVEVRGHLSGDRDVVVGQYLTRTEFIEQLESTARERSARFHELLLVLDEDELARRLAARRATPTRPEHRINDRYVDPGQARELLRSLDRIPQLRPGTVSVDARGDLSDVLDRTLGVLLGGSGR